jgi:IS30 family transposase
MQEVLQQVERAAVEEARAQDATWSQVAEALNRTRQAVEQQRFG